MESNQRSPRKVYGDRDRELVAMKKCDICGKPIPKTRTSNNLRYCSPKCARQAESGKRIDRIALRAKSHNTIAMKVYGAYNCKCAICQWQATPELVTDRNGKLQYAHGNEIHHITPASEGGTDSPDNVILLCPNHHKQADIGIISRAELRKYTKDYTLTEENKADAKARVADTIATAIF